MTNSSCARSLRSFRQLPDLVLMPLASRSASSSTPTASGCASAAASTTDSGVPVRLGDQRQFLCAGPVHRGRSGRQGRHDDGGSRRGWLPPPPGLLLQRGSAPRGSCWARGSPDTGARPTPGRGVPRGGRRDGCSWHAASASGPWSRRRCGGCRRRSGLPGPGQGCRKSSVSSSTLVDFRGPFTVGQEEVVAGLSEIQPAVR